MTKIKKKITIYIAFLLLAASCTQLDTNRRPSSLLENKSCSFLVNQIVKEDSPKELLHKHLEKSASYAIVLNDQSQTLYLNYRNTIEENGEIVLIFQKLSKDDVIRSDQVKHIKLKDIFALKKTKLSSKPKSETINPLAYIFSPLVIVPILTNIIGWGNLMFRPYKSLIKNQSIEIVSKNIFAGKKIKEQAKHILEEFSSYDKIMNEAGFYSPKSSKIVLLKQSQFLKTFDSQVIPFDILRIKNGYQHFSFLNPLLSIKNLNFGNTIMIHERTHSLLRRTFKFNAFILRRSVFEEAFADVLSAHFYNNPKIGMDAITQGKELRNLETNISYNIDGKIFSANSILDLDHKNQHDISLFASTLLWKIKKSNNSNSFYKIMRSLADELNNHYDSFSNSKYIDFDKLVYSDLQYFMSILYKLSLEDQSFKTYNELITDHIKSLNLDLDQLKQIASSLEKTKKDYQYEGPPVLSDMLITTSGTAMAGFGGFIVYSILKPKNDD